MIRALGALILVNLFVGCVTDSNYRSDDLGAVSASPWPSPFGYGNDGPFFPRGYSNQPYWPYGYRRSYDNDQPFRPRRHVLCDPDDQVCYKNGHPDPSETRDIFGKKAARRID